MARGLSPRVVLSHSSMRQFSNAMDDTQLDTTLSARNIENVQTLIVGGVIYLPPPQLPMVKELRNVQRRTLHLNRFITLSLILLAFWMFLPLVHASKNPTLQDMLQEWVSTTNYTAKGRTIPMLMTGCRRRQCRVNRSLPTLKRTHPPRTYPRVICSKVYPSRFPLQIRFQNQSTELSMSMCSILLPKTLYTATSEFKVTSSAVRRITQFLLEDFMSSVEHRKANVGQ